MDIEVLIYVQNIRKMLENNPESMTYMVGDGDIEVFLLQLTEISGKNFETKGDPKLTREQFEEIRKIITNLPITTEESNGVFQDIKGFGKFCLN